MKASQFFISTLKEAPAEAEIISHQLMIRSGMIKRVGSGIYTLMPMGLRSVRKVEQIVREEMNRAGAMELLMPAVQPAELWQESGRWEQYGPELLRFKDRHERDFVVGPTHEEVITDVARREIKSYKQLPVNWYQIQAKFRDEIRPRFGVMRGREFIMKDAYSFDKDADSLKHSYDKMFNAYMAIFTRLGLNFRAVAADNGSIGGSGSHEFHVIAETGEDDIVYNPNSDYAATGLITLGLLFAGGFASLQSVSVIAGLPFSFILLIYMLSMWSSLRQEGHKRKASGVDMPALIGNGLLWRERLARIVNFPSLNEAKKFMQYKVHPAMLGVAQELNKQGIETKVVRNDEDDNQGDHLSFEVMHGEEVDFVYQVYLVEAIKPVFALEQSTNIASLHEQDKYYRAEVYLSEGSQEYDLLGYTKEQIIADILNQYERHMQFLHLKR